MHITHFSLNERMNECISARKKVAGVRISLNEIKHLRQNREELN